MNGEGALKFFGEVELGLQAVELVFDVEGLFPAVESAFADGGGGIGFEELTEGLQPVGTAFENVPGVEAEGGEDFGMGVGELLDIGPVLLGGAVDEHASDSMGACLGEGFFRFGKLLEMVVGVGHGVKSWRAAFSKEASWWSGMAMVLLGVW